MYDLDYYRSYGGLEYGRFSMHWWSDRYFLKLLKKHKHGGTLLEIGCGTGNFLSRLSAHFHTYGIDASEAAVELARLKCPGSRLACMKVQDLEVFPEDLFDVIVSRHVFEHIREPGTVLRACYRVARPGGILLFTVPNVHSLGKVLKKERWYGYRDETHVSLLTGEEWKALTRGAGFRVLKVFSDGLWDAPYIPVVPARLQKVVFGSLGGLQALLALTFMPVALGEALVVLAEKPSLADGNGRCGGHG